MVLSRLEQGVRLPEPTQSEPGRHKRKDGSECPYLASETCNKCGWVDCQPRAPDPVPEPVVHNWVKKYGLEVCQRCGVCRRADNQNKACTGYLPAIEPRAAEPRKEPERELDFKTFCTGEPPPHDWDASAPTAAFCRRCGVYRPYAVRTWTREQIEAALDAGYGEDYQLDIGTFWRALEGT